MEGCNAVFRRGRQNRHLPTRGPIITAKGCLPLQSRKTHGRRIKNTQWNRGNNLPTSIKWAGKKIKQRVVPKKILQRNFILRDPPKSALLPKHKLHSVAAWSHMKFHVSGKPGILEENFKNVSAFPQTLIVPRSRCINIRIEHLRMNPQPIGPPSEPHRSRLKIFVRLGFPCLLHRHIRRTSKSFHDRRKVCCVKCIQTGTNNLFHSLNC